MEIPPEVVAAKEALQEPLLQTSLITGIDVRALRAVTDYPGQTTSRSDPSAGSRSRRFLGLTHSAAHRPRGHRSDLSTLNDQRPTSKGTDMPLPKEPRDIPPEAFAVLASLRAEIESRLPADARFGIGAKQTNGEFLDELALIVYVPQKLPIERLAPSQMIPTVWREQNTDFPTDVVESNPTPSVLVNDSNFYQPLLGGIEIGTLELVDGLGHQHTGTMGCIVQRRSDGNRGGLTCEHVAAMGSDVWQPREGLGSGAFRASIIGKVESAVSHAMSAWQDCALIEFNGLRGVPEPVVRDIGPVQGSAQVQLFELVKKRGRTTGRTTGRVAAVIPDGSTYGISHMIVTADPPGVPFCWHGDSGSVVLNVRHEVIGLLIAMDFATIDANGEPVASAGLAIPIQIVQDVLGIEIAVSPPVITRIEPNTALAVLTGGGWTQIDGWGFDAGSQVSFGGVPALTVTPASPRRLVVTPPVQFIPGQSVNVVVTNAVGEQSVPSTNAQFTY